MDITCNKVTNDITITKARIPLVNSNNDAHEHSYTINQRTTNKNKSDKLQLYHQNIRGLHNKTEELTTQWTNQFPHLLCFSEHHLKESEINNIHINYYTLGASYCRNSCSHGGVGIFVHNTLSFSTINLNQICNDYDFEACAIKLIISTNIYFILCIYRPPAGNFTAFLLHLESVLTQLYSNTINLIICGDINVNYLQDSRNKFLLNSLLASFNLHSAVNFPTRISNSSSTTIDNIFIDKTKNTLLYNPYLKRIIRP